MSLVRVGFLFGFLDLGDFLVLSLPGLANMNPMASSAALRDSVICVCVCMCMYVYVREDRFDGVERGFA